MWLQGTLVLVLCYLTVNVNAQLGRSCQTPNGEWATCKSIYDCKILLDVVRTPNQGQIRFLRESQCGHSSGNPLVCCGSKDNFASSAEGIARKATNRNSDVPQNNEIPDRSTCGATFSDRIFHGENTTIEEFPWMALLEYKNAAGRKRFSCGGTIISPRYVLTAAHCITGEITKKVGDLVNVRLGEWNIDTVVDCVDQICNNPPEDIEIEKTIVHPNYDNNLADRYYDIALIRLKKKINYTNFIRPICLPLPNESSRIGENLTVAGWGKTESRNRSPIKQKLEVPIAEKSQCSNKFRSAGVTLDDSQLCAGGIEGKDSCTGDSGGPLMRVTRNDSSQWYIEGVVSFGAACGSKGWPGIYTKVTTYLEWIHKNVTP